MKIIFSAFLAVLLLLPAASFGQDKPDERTVSATGTSTGDYPPDTAVITLAVETEAKEVKEATARNNEKAERMIAGVKKLLGEEDSIKTTSYAIHPIYEYDSDKRKQFVAGYRALNQVTVRTRKVKEAGVFIDAAIKAGANRVDGLRFELSEYPAPCGELIAQASKRALSEAQAAAGAFGEKVKGVKTLSPSCTAEPEPRPVFMMKEAAAPVEPGGVNVRATVSAVFYLE